MQTAYKEVREAANQPVQSLMMEPGHSVVLWTPETLDLSRKQVGLQRIEARNFAVFFDQAILDRDQSETIFQDQSGQPRQLVRYTKTATACAVEVLIQFGARGVVILDSLLDRPQGALVQFEAKLVNAGWFDREKNPRLDDLIGIISELTAAGAWSDDKEGKAATDLLQAISTAITYRATYADDMMGEAQRAREGKQGRANLTREEQTYLSEIGFAIPTDVAALDVKKAAAQVQLPGVSPEVIELMQANNQALVSVMTDALNKQAEVFIRMLEMKGAQSGTGTDGKQPDAGIINDAGQTIIHRELPGHPGYVESYVAEPKPGDGDGAKAAVAGGSARGSRGAEEEDGESDGGGGIDTIIADAGKRVTGARTGNKAAGGSKSGSKSGNA